MKLLRITGLAFGIAAALSAGAAFSTDDPTARLGFSVIAGIFGSVALMILLEGDDG